jgi:c-di-GMP-binding flagellar brake protein YcgR
LRIDEIVKGGSIEIEVLYSGKIMNFKSEVAFVKNNSILINSIKVNDQTIGFSDKYQINFLYKQDGRLFLWDKVTVKLVKYTGGIYHMIELSGEGRAYNRRDSYRIYIGEDMPLYVNTASGPTALSVLVKDISESGVGFITKEEIDLDRTIRLKLKDGSTVISLSGVIVRKEFLENLNSNLYGCKFNEKNSKLGKYIAKRQSETIKKKTESPLSKGRQNKAKKQANTESKQEQE